MQTGEGKDGDGEGKDGDEEGKDGDWRREGWILERERMGKKGLRLEGCRL